MKQKPSTKKYFNYVNPSISFVSKLTKVDQSLKRNKSGFPNLKESKSTNHLAIAFQSKMNNSFLSQEFDNYYDNFLKSLHEESTDKQSNVYNPTYKKDKHYHSRKSTGVSLKVKRSSVQFKPFTLQHQKSEHNLDLHKSGMGMLPEIKINAYDSNLSKGTNNEQSELQNFQVKSMFNDNESRYTTNKQLEPEILDNNNNNILTMNNLNNNEYQMEMNANNNNHFNVNNIMKNSHVSCLSQKSIAQSIQGSNILSVKHTENFTLGEQMLVKKKPSKDNLISPKYVSPRGAFKYKNQNNNIDSNNNNNNNNILNFNVMHINPINSFNNAQKINICKKKNSTPLNSNRISNRSKVNSKNPSPRYNHDYHSMNSSFDGVTKRNEMVMIKKTNSKPISKKASNKNIMNNNNIMKHNNTQLLQIPRIPSQRNDEKNLFSSDYELKDKTKYSYQEQQNIVQPAQNFQSNEFINLKPRKFFLCIPCK